MKFANISNEVLGLYLGTVDDKYLTLQSLIESECDEDIIYAKYVVSGKKNDLHITNFTAWTQNYVLVLVYSLGYNLLKIERSPYAN